MRKMDTGDLKLKMIRALRERLPFEKINVENMVTKKSVPVHQMSWAYYFGGLALFFFTIQLITGLLLLFYYEATVSDAYLSVHYITHIVPFGGIIRNMHSWSSSGMILSVVLHLITTFAMKAFQKPRELTWLSGVIMLAIVMTFGFTGYLLPWHQIAVNATKVGLQTVELVGDLLPGPIADWPRIIKEIVQGGPAVGQATLSRFYALHVVVLPLGLLGILGFHLFSVQLHGMSKGVDKPTGKEEKFFPDFILKDLRTWVVAFFVLLIVAICLPFDSFFSFPLFGPFDALSSTPDGIKPEWYFLFLYYPLELLPFALVMIIAGAGKLGLIATPWIFQGSSRKTLTTLAILMVAYLLVMTLFGQNIYDFFKKG
jgi:cytochrome b6